MDHNEKQQKKREIKTAREQEQRAKERRSNTVYAIIAVVFVAVAVVTLVWNSKIIQKRAAAATIGIAETSEESGDSSSADESASSAEDTDSSADTSADTSAEVEPTIINGVNYTAAEVSYFYGAVYQQFMSYYGDYASYFGLDTSTPLDEQEYSDGVTWHDYFLEQALNQMTEIQAMLERADSEGYQYPDDLEQQVSEQLQETETNALSNGYSSLKQYLVSAYGELVTKSVVEKQMLRVLKASAFAEDYYDNLTYTDDELEAAYQEDTDSYDMVDYAYVQVSGTAPSTTDEDGNTVDPTDEETAAALEAAEDTVNAIYEAWQDGENLSDLADAYADNGASYVSDEEGTYSSSTVMDWLFDESREDGDSEILEDDDQFYLAVFYSRYRPEFYTSDVRHILISPADGELSEGDEGYEEEQEQLMADAKAEAERILEEWKSGEATEESFAALATEYSADTGSAEDGGLISGISKVSSYVENFLNWSIDESRQTGDTDIVESTYGYHIMYYVNRVEPYWKTQVRGDLQDSDYNAWYTETTEGYQSQQQDGIKYVG